MPDRWICPFCPLHCEDATIEPRSGGLPRLEPACPRGQAFVERLDWDRQAPLPAELAGQPVAYEKAMAAAAERLRRAPQIAIRGSFGGFSLGRSIVDFGESLGACLEPTTSVGQQALRRAISRDGLISATLGDVRRYADLVLLIGQPELAYPRLLERFASDGLVAGRTRQRVSIELRDAADRGAAPFALAEQPTARLAVSPAELAVLIAQWQRTDEPSAAPPALAPELTARLHRAEYIAVILGPDAFAPWGLLGGELEAAGLLAAVARWNRHRRAVLVASDASASFRQVAVWRSGFAGPVGWNQNRPFPLERGGFARLWDAPETVRLEIAVPAAPYWPNERTADADAADAGAAGGDSADEAAPADILLASEGVAGASGRTASIVLPIAAPGVDTADTVVRGKGSVTLPLRHLRRPLEPTLPETLAALAAAAGRQP